MAEGKALEEDRRPGGIAIIILAAGLSRRMGAPKLLMRLGSRPLLGHVIHHALASQLSPVVVVASPYLAARQAEWQHPAGGATGRLHVVVNPDPARGMGSSLKLGIGALPPGVEGAVIALGDQPLLPPGIFSRLAEAYRKGRAPVVAPVYGGRRGHPVLVAARLFPELLTVTGDEGGRRVLERYKEATCLIPFPDPLAGMDADTPADLERLRRAYEAMDGAGRPPGRS